MPSDSNKQPSYKKWRVLLCFFTLGAAVLSGLFLYANDDGLFTISTKHLTMDYFRVGGRNRSSSKSKFDIKANVPETFECQLMKVTAPVTATTEHGLQYKKHHVLSYDPDVCSLYGIIQNYLPRNIRWVKGEIKEIELEKAKHGTLTQLQIGALVSFGVTCLTSLLSIPLFFTDSRSYEVCITIMILITTAVSTTFAVFSLKFAIVYVSLIKKFQPEIGFTAEVTPLAIVYITTTAILHLFAFLISFKVTVTTRSESSRPKPHWANYPGYKLHRDVIKEVKNIQAPSNAYFVDNIPNIVLEKVPESECSKDAHERAEREAQRAKRYAMYRERFSVPSERIHHDNK